MRASIVVAIDPNSYVDHSNLYLRLTLLDICFSSLVIAPLVVTFWSSTWTALAHFTLFSRTPTVNVCLVPVILGFVTLLLFTTYQKHIKVIFTEYVGNRFLYFFSSRLYTEIFGIASVSSWFGVWKTVDVLTNSDVYFTILILIASCTSLVCTKTVRNIAGSPFVIATDKKQGYFDVPTLFQWSYYWKKNKLLYVLDSIFSVFIVGTLVILVWRGAWCLLDEIIYPKDYELSGWTSLAIGYFIVFITFFSQSCMKWLIRREDGWKRLLILDIYVVISFCGTVNIWRGIWILLEEYTNLDNSLRNCILLHFLSFFILVIFNASNTLLVRGVYIDAGEGGEESVEFPCYYFRLRFQEKQKKKAIAQLNGAEQKINGFANGDGENSVNNDQVTEYIDQDSDGELGKQGSEKYIDESDQLRLKYKSHDVPVATLSTVTMESEK